MSTSRISKKSKKSILTRSRIRNRNRNHSKMKHSKHNRCSYNNSSYQVYEIPNFLTASECDLLIQIATLKGLAQSEVFELGATNDQVTIKKDHRNSETVWLVKNDDIVERIAKRVAERTNTHINLQEDMQCVHYGKGGVFKEHHDSYTDEELVQVIQNGNRQRFGTFLIYLNDNYTGGETIFPLLPKKIKPKKGKAIYFKNIDDNHTIIPESLHIGSTIKSGEKWIANIWIGIDVDVPECDVTCDVTCDVNCDVDCDVT